MVFGGFQVGIGYPQEVLGAPRRFWGPPGDFGCPQEVLGAPRRFRGASRGAHLLQGFDALLQQAVLGAEALGKKSGKKSGKNQSRGGADVPRGVLMSPALTRPQAAAARPQLTLISICSSISLFLMAAYSFSSLRGTRGRAGTRGRGQAPARASRGGVPGGRSPSSPLHLLGVVLDLEGPEDELVGAAVELVRDHLLEVLRAQPGLKPRPQNAALVSSSAPKHGPKSSPARQVVPKHSPQPPPVKTPTKSAPKRVPSDRNLLQNAAHQVNDP